MAAKKPATKTVKVTRAKKAAKAKKVSAPKKSRKPRKSKKAEEDSNAPNPLKQLSRQLVLEYRAVLAEWKVAYGESQLVNQKLISEKTLPKHQELLRLMQLMSQAEEDTRSRGVELQRVQELVADSVGLTVEDFRKNYVIDLETGAINNSDF